MKAIALGLTGLLLLGCNTDLGIEDHTWKCSTDGDCLDGYTCVSQVCTATSGTTDQDTSGGTTQGGTTQGGTTQGGTTQSDNLIAINEGQLISADLDEGYAIAEFGWAVSSACWTGSETKHYNGNHVLFALSEVPLTVKTAEITLIPTAPHNMNLYAYTNDKGVFDVPPNINVNQCERAHDQPAQSSEIIELNFGSRQLMIGVSAPDGQTQGGFKLKVVWKE